MCFIFRKPADQKFPFDLMEAAHERNPDGFGVMFHEDGIAQERIILPDNFGQVKKLYLQHHRNPIAAHFRMRTVGDIDETQCHPYKILNKDEDGINMFMMHNGTLHVKDIETGYQAKDSDSQQLVDKYLKPTLKSNPALIHLEPFQTMLSNLIGSSNRLVFLDDTGEFVIINQHTGHDLEEGIWISNLYGIPGHDDLGYLLSQHKDLKKREKPAPKVYTSTTTSHGANPKKHESSLYANHEWDDATQTWRPRQDIRRERALAKTTGTGATEKNTQVPMALLTKPKQPDPISKTLADIKTQAPEPETRKEYNEDYLDTIRTMLGYTNAQFDADKFEQLAIELSSFDLEEVWQFCVQSPEEAAFYIHNSLANPGNII